MDDIQTKLLELLYQLPVAALMLVVVWKFLQVIKERDANWLDTVRDRDTYFLGELTKHQLASNRQHHETIEVIRQNSVALHQSAQTMERVDSKLTQDALARASSVGRGG